MLEKLKCLLGLHKWMYTDHCMTRRECDHCGAREHHQYNEYGVAAWVRV